MLSAVPMDDRSADWKLLTNRPMGDPRSAAFARATSILCYGLNTPTTSISIKPVTRPVAKLARSSSPNQ